MERFYRLKTIVQLFVIYYLAVTVGGWKAVPANQATYALRSSFGRSDDEEIPDGDLPRDSINHIYKFGWCTSDVIALQFLRKSVNVTMPSWQSTQGNYLYLLNKGNTQRYSLQCIIMKSYVPQKFLFLKSRLPLFYCQGTVFILMLQTISKYEIHEFFLYQRLNMPINFNFEFYHPQIL